MQNRLLLIVLTAIVSMGMVNHVAATVSADLALTISTDVTTVPLGSTDTYRFVIQNNSANASANRGFFIPASSNPPSGALPAEPAGVTCNKLTNKDISCQLPPINPGASVTVTVNFNIPSALTGNQVCVFGHLIADGSDPNPSNDQKQLCLPFSGLTISVLKQGTNGQIFGQLVNSCAGCDFLQCPPGPCTAKVASGAAVKLYTIAPAGSLFLGWSNGSGSAKGCHGPEPCAFVVAENSNVFGTFSAPVTISVTEQGGGSGTVVMKNNNTIITNQCPSLCSMTMPAGSQVTLTATAASGSVFSGWTNGTASATGCTKLLPCTFVIQQNSTVAANFVIPK